MKVAQDINVDGITIVITDDNKDGQPKLNSQVIFTERELQVPPAQIQQLLFRELANSNKLMVCTGFQYQNEWYGDRPDNGMYKNPFDNEDEWIGEKPEVKPQVVVQETWQGVQLSLIGVPNNALKFTQLKDVSWNNQVFDSSLQGVTQASEVENSVNIQFHSTNTVVSYANEFRITFKIGNDTYTALLPKIKGTSGLGTFAVQGDSFLELFTVSSNIGTESGAVNDDIEE